MFIFAKLCLLLKILHAQICCIHCVMLHILHYVTYDKLCYMLCYICFPIITRALLPELRTVLPLYEKNTSTIYTEFHSQRNIIFSLFF